MASNSNSGQKFISRNRKPRVHITYEGPKGETRIELPFVMGVLADLSGNASEVAKPEFEKRKFLDIDMDSFDSRMNKIEPTIAMRVANKLGGAEGWRDAPGDAEVPQDGRFLAGGDRPAGARDGEIAGGARKTVQPDEFHGREGPPRRTL